MLLFGHLGITLGIFFGLGIFIPRLRTIIDPKYLVIGALLPDLADKPIGRVIFASSVANGRIIGHTILFSLLLLLIGLCSVSYTHLRAHETGRNLVCRLLL